MFQSILSNQFILGLLAVLVAIPLSIAGILILALPLGIVGGILVIKEMINKQIK